MVHGRKREPLRRVGKKWKDLYYFPPYEKFNV